MHISVCFIFIVIICFSTYFSYRKFDHINTTTIGNSGTILSGSCVEELTWAGTSAHRSSRTKVQARSLCPLFGEQYLKDATRPKPDDGFARGAFASGRLPPFFWKGGGPSKEPEALLLTHQFTAENAPGIDSDTLLLVTLLVPDASLTPELLPDAFGAGAKVALRGSGRTQGLCTAVLAGPALAATELSEADIQRLPSATRQHLRAAQRLQILAAIRSCVQAEDAGCYLAVQGSLESVGASDEAVQAAELLARALWRQRGGSNKARGGMLTTGHLGQRRGEAEGLERIGLFNEAAALYKENIMDHMKHPELNLIPSPPLAWDDYGLALKNAGRHAEAAQAYAQGIRALAGRVSPDTAEWRETLRLMLGGHALNNVAKMNPPASVEARCTARGLRLHCAPERVRLIVFPNE